VHPLLGRQLKKSGLLDAALAQPGESWARLLERVSQAYADADQERYLLERALSVSSREMEDLSQRLAQERDRLTAILHSLGDGLCALDPDGRVLIINPEGERLLGWSQDELVGRDLLATVAAPPAADDERPVGSDFATLQELVGAGRAHRNEDGFFIRKDGALVPVSYVLTPLAHEGRLSGAVLVFRDTTEHKRAVEARTELIRVQAARSEAEAAQRRLSVLANENAELYRQAQAAFEEQRRAAARRQALLMHARRFAAESNAERVLTDLLEAAVAVLGGDDGTLSSWDAPTRVLRPVRNSVATADEYTVIRLGEGVSGRAAEHRKVVILNDYQRESGDETPAGKAGVRAAVAAPLLHEGRLLGALSVNTHDPERRFTDEDAELLELLAGIASGVLAGLEHTSQLASANLGLQRARDEAQYQALHDPLTGLPNRTLLRDRLEQSMLLADRNATGLALLLLDLDRFKDVNDTLGHHAGDELLQQVGARLAGALRTSDTIARMGGDEFAVILLTAGDVGLATRLARTLVHALEAPFVVGGHTVAVGASIGIAVYPDQGTDARTLLRRADVAMYVAKRANSGYSVYSPDQDEHGSDRLAFIAELRAAIDRDELVLHYQPKVSLKTGRCVRAEALVRWNHPQRGLIPPDQFVPVAEQTGLIKPLTRWVLDAALRQCRTWRDSGLELPVAVNLSMLNLHDPELTESVAELLATWGVPPVLLKVEVTESAIMSDPERAVETLRCLRAMGVAVAIDDFGTGHSSLNYLKHLPVEDIKLDRTFVREMRVDDSDFAIVRSTVQLAHSLDLQVIAEGVEDQETWDLLAALGCDAAQGYYMSRPLPAEDLECWLHDSPWGLHASSSGEDVTRPCELVRAA